MFISKGERVFAALAAAGAAVALWGGLLLALMRDSDAGYFLLWTAQLVALAAYAAAQALLPEVSADE